MKARSLCPLRRERAMEALEAVTLHDPSAMTVTTAQARSICLPDAPAKETTRATLFGQVQSRIFP